MELELATREVEMTDENVEQMLMLAERLRISNGGDLDESAILAVAEATGAPVEYVRLAVKLRTEKEKRSFLGNLRSQYRTLEANTRRCVLSGAAATGGALLMAADDRVSRLTQVALHADYGIFTMFSTIACFLGVYNVMLSRNIRTAAIAGAILTAGMFLMHAVFDLVFAVRVSVDTTMFPLLAVAGAGGGALLYQFVQKYRTKLGMKDPTKERQDLLRQLSQLQEKLNSGSQYTAFLSVDIVGSTRMKELADPLAVEYTFNEYHEFVGRVSHKYGGRVHSTAGDGIICAFDQPQQAFAAAKNIQTGLIELNTHRNKIGVPIVVRSGIHSGSVIAPDAGDVTSVNFSRVIDIAAHLQKAAPPGGVVVSEESIAHLSGGMPSVGSERVRAENVGGVIWLPGRSAVAVSPSVMPPPLPHTKPA